jgi:hypothetical protein
MKILPGSNTVIVEEATCIEVVDIKLYSEPVSPTSVDSAGRFASFTQRQRIRVSRKC